MKGGRKAGSYNTGEDGFLLCPWGCRLVVCHGCRRFYQNYPPLGPQKVTKTQFTCGAPRMPGWRV
ncbi:hypothetical protein THTE_2868 [Thermogutta terrifontis]|uniref:Uncharacterized protein n=1 Tax=Thermogutta terrifontis TaxID=1331910 RepID=A0A286RHN6_9BACT|nr:hypothetical protein THTE_2868 [Thermogutta terrifontis]